MNIEQRLARLDKAVEDNSVKRGQWTACLLAQLSPEAEKASSASACPATVMPPWLAHLTPWIDDAGTIDHWPSVVRRYASLAHRWNALTPDQWHRLDYRVRAICVREAMAHTKNENVIDVCGRVVELCDRVARGDEVPEQDWAAEAAAAVEARAAAARTAAARTAAAEAAAARTAAARTAAAAAAAAEAEAADRMIDAIMDAIESEVAK